MKVGLVFQDRRPQCEAIFWLPGTKDKKNYDDDDKSSDDQWLWSNIDKKWKCIAIVYSSKRKHSLLFMPSDMNDVKSKKDIKEDIYRRLKGCGTIVTKLIFI